MPLGGIGKLDSRIRRHDRHQTQRSRNGLTRQVGHARIRLRRTVRRRALPRRQKSLEYGAYSRRLEQRFRRRARRRSLLRRSRFRHRRIDPHAVVALWHRRHQTDLRPGQPLRRHPAQLVPRSRRTDGAQRRRLRDHAASPGRLRCQGQRLGKCCRAEFSDGNERRHQRSAHRRAAQKLVR